MPWSQACERCFNLMQRVLVLVLLIGFGATACKTKRPVPPPGVFYPTPGVTPPGMVPQERQITFQGEVRNPVVMWTPGLTLAFALVQAEYFGARDPQMIYIFRKEQAIRVDPSHLLSGIKDPVLQPGDIVELRR